MHEDIFDNITFPCKKKRSEEDMKAIQKRILSLAMSLLVIITTVLGNANFAVYADETENKTASTIAAWSYTANPADWPTSPTSGDAVDGITLGTTDCTALTLQNINKNYGLAVNGMKSTDGWLISNVNGTNYSTMNLAATLRSSNTGPANFQTYYSLDGSEWNAVGETIPVKNGKSSLAVTLPEELDGKCFSIKIAPCMNADGKLLAVNGTDVTESNYASNSATNINDVVITGIQTGTSETPVTPTCSEVTASVPAGQVAEGTTVELACATEGAGIYYNTNGTENYSLYEGAITITETTTIYAYAECEGYHNSTRKSFTYTVVNENLVTPLATGDQVTFFCGNAGMVMTTTASGTKLSGVAATVDADKNVLQVTKTNENAALVESIALFDVTLDENGCYTFTNNGKYLTTGATGSSLTLEETASDYSLWQIYEASASGKYLLKNVNAAYTDSKTGIAYSQYIEFYNTFTTYSLKDPSKDSAFALDFCAMPEIIDNTEEEPEKPEKPEDSEESGNPENPEDSEDSENSEESGDSEDPETNLLTATLTSELKDGNVVTIYYENGDNDGILLSTTADGKKLTGVTAIPADGVVTVPEGAAQMTVSMDENGYCTFITEDGKYLTSGATGNSLSFADAASDYSLWEVKEAANGFYIVNVNAKYGTSNQYIEYYSGFTTYSYKEANDPIYVYQFYKVKEGTPSVKVDASYTAAVAGWGGAMIASGATVEATTVNGDLYEINDGLDTSSVFTAVVDGVQVPAYTDPNKAGNNHYMGASNFGNGDYLQFETSSYGYGNMDLTFRMRVSNAAPAEYQLQYSTDGMDFKNFTTGSYESKYTVYTSNSSSEAEYTGTVTNGIAKMSKAVASAGAYVTFKFDVPAGASHAEKLYIRVVGGAAKASEAAGEPSGNVRIDTVKITGNPVIASDVTGYVKCTIPAETAVGQTLELTTATEGAVIYYSINGSEFAVYDAANKPVLEVLPANVVAYAQKEGMAASIKTYVSFTQQQCEMVKATPNGGAVVLGTNVTLKTNTEGASILYAVVSEGTQEEKWETYSGSLILDTLPATIKVKAVKDGYLESVISTLNFTERENEFYNIYFGQLHSHTNYSDGAGTVEEAFQYAANVENLDFLAVTDHSNSLDNEANSVITKNVDTAATDEWTMGHSLAEQYSTDDFTCIYGYEMTWSNGLGHMNTFNTKGFQSRTQAEYKTYSTALQNYYEALNTAPDSLSMFNHPGTTFGDFSDFAYYSEANDALITMIEVGNGEGEIGSSGYFPSYEYYTRALDKGWHVSPTNNQDNHKGKWGDANTARSVVLADKNTEEDIYDAMRNNRMYATEDNNLSIYYTLDGFIMGTSLEKDQVGDKVTLSVDLKDADKEALGKVEVIVNGGLSIANKKFTTNEELVTFEVPANYSYYYIKVTQADGDIAVTSPVWVGEVEACGINNTYTNAALAVQGEALDINIDFYNNETSELVLDSLEVAVGDVVVHSADAAALTNAGVGSIAAEGTATYSFDYAHNGVGATTYNVTVNATLNGVAKVYKDVLELSYTTPELVTKVIVDGSHYNDYVTGYYGGNVGAFIDICADKNIKAVIDTDGITAEDLSDCALLVVSAPAKKSGTANAGDYTVSHFEDDFIALVADYVKNGGSIIVCGTADYQDSADGQTSTELNKLLEAIGSTIKVNSDEGYDEVNNGGQAYRLYLTNYNADSKWLAGVVEGQEYSAYSGCTVDITEAAATDFVSEAAALVKGHDTTYSIDSKTATGAYGDSSVVVEKGNVIELAVQETAAGGNIFVAGTVFLSDFEVEAEIDNNDSLPYMNYNILSNILSDVEKQLPISTIAEARQGNIGDFYSVEGYVTAGTANEYNTFFDAIYIQDATGGICVFPFSEAGLAIGTKMKVTGYIDEYQGDKEIQVLSYEIVEDAPYIWEAKKLTTKQATDYATYGGQLVNVTGKVTRVEYTSDKKGIAEVWVMDDSGAEAAVFIDGYILSGTEGTNTLASFVKEGVTISAAGILYMHPEGSSDVSVPVLRVRNCDEIVFVADAEKPEVPDETETPETPEVPGETETPETPEVPGETETPEAPEMPGETETPEAPEVPGETETPEAPEVPGETETPEDSEEPEDSTESEDSEKTDNTETSDEKDSDDKNSGSGKKDASISVKNAFDWSNVIAAINNAANGAEIHVVMSTTTTISADVLKALQGKDVNVVIQLNNGILWIINGKNITDTNLGDIDLGVMLNTDAIPEKLVAAVAEGNKYIQMSLKHNGSFGFEAVLRVNAGVENAGKYVKLYYYNEATGKLEYKMNALIKADGTVDLLFTHASDYVMVIDKAAAVDTGDNAPIAGMILLLFAGVLILVAVLKKKQSH